MCLFSYIIIIICQKLKTEKILLYISLNLAMQVPKEIAAGPLTGQGPQCRMSNLRNNTVCCPYCKRRYFCVAKFSRIKPYGAYSCILIFAHMPVNSICSIMIKKFTRIKISRIYGPVRNARKYVLHENFYVHSILQYLRRFFKII